MAPTFEETADKIIGLIDQAKIDLQTIRAEWDLGSPPGLYDPEVYRTYRDKELTSMKDVVKKLSDDVDSIVKK